MTYYALFVVAQLVTLRLCDHVGCLQMKRSCVGLQTSSGVIACCFQIPLNLGASAGDKTDLVPKSWTEVN